MNLILVLLLAAVAWYLLSGLGTRQRVGGSGNGGSNDRDFRVRTARSSTDAMNTTMNSTADTNSNQGTKWVQPEDAKQKNGQPSVSADGAFQGQQQNQGQNQSGSLQSSTYNFGEDSGTLTSMQDQAGANQTVTDWQTQSLSNQGQNGGSQMTNGAETGLTQEIGNLYNNSLYDGGMGSYEGTNLSANTGIEAGGNMGQNLNASGGTQEVNAYQPQLTGFSDATTTDENGNKVTSIQDKRQGKKNKS